MRRAFCEWKLVTIQIIIHIRIAFVPVYSNRLWCLNQKRNNSCSSKVTLWRVENKYLETKSKLPTGFTVAFKRWAVWLFFQAGTRWSPSSPPLRHPPLLTVEVFAWCKKRSCGVRCAAVNQSNRRESVRSHRNGQRNYPCPTFQSC